jgi:hypothetical protein
MGTAMISSWTQREISRRQTQLKFPYIIKISSDDLGDFYYANSDQDIYYNGQKYDASVFSVQPPDKDGSRIGNAQITISAVDQEWIQRIRSTQKPAKLHFIATIANGDQVLEPLEENTFTLRQAGWNEVAITWTMNFDENQSILIPSEKCTAITTPGCS